MASDAIFPVKFLNEVHLSIFCSIKKLCYTVVHVAKEIQYRNLFVCLFVIQSLGEFQPAEFTGAIYCEPPHSKIYDFSGYMYVIVCGVLCDV